MQELAELSLPNFFFEYHQLSIKTRVFGCIATIFSWFHCYYFLLASLPLYPLASSPPFLQLIAIIFATLLPPIPLNYITAMNLVL